MDVRYTDSHEWIRLNGKEGLVGISNHAQKELGEIVYVELPVVGEEVKAGGELAVVESTKAATDIYSPVSGIVVRVNCALKERPSLINSSPEQEGWIAVIALSSLSELEALLSDHDYSRLL